MEIEDGVARPEAGAPKMIGDLRWSLYTSGMNTTPETEQLQEALTKLATVMTRVICARVDQAVMQIMAGRQPGQGDGTSVARHGNGWPAVAGAEEYIDKREVARRLGKTVRTVDGWMSRGILPYYKIGRSVQFRWSEVQDHLAQTSRVRFVL